MATKTHEDVEVASRDLQVHVELKELSNVIEETHERLRRLHSRLEAVMHDFVPLNPEVAPQTEEHLVPLAASLRAQAQHAHSMIDMLDSFMNNLEV